MAALGTTVSLAKIGGGNVWHFTDGEAGDGVEVKALCGRAGALGDYQQDVDANVIRHQGAKVCADCKTIIDAGGSPQNGGTMSTTTAEKPKSGAADTVTSDALKKAIARAEKAIASQPKRTEVDLTQAKADKAFTLGKSIAAGRYNLKRAKAGKTSAATVASLVDRIEARVAERNKIRRGK